MATKTKPKKIVVEIEATDWNKTNLTAFKKWLDNELSVACVHTGDDARVVSVKFAPTKKK